MEELLPRINNLFEFLSTHKEMLDDKVRFKAYAQAIKQTIRPGDVVVDIGTGTGLLAFLAIKAGAKKVYAIERENIIKTAEQLAIRNSMISKISFIEDDSRNVSLPEKCDVIISEILGHSLLDENMLDSILDAKNRLMKRQGKIIPKRIRLFAVPVENSKVFSELSFWKNNYYGIDLSPAWEKAINTIYVTSIQKNNFLASPLVLLDLDLFNNKSIDINGEVSFNPFRKGTLHGFASWFEAELSENIKIYTGPDAPKTHWEATFFPISKKTPINEDDIIDFYCQCGSSSKTTIWEWKMEINKENKTCSIHSTSCY
jgi:SAM-dependent methyltransferase